MVSIIMKDVSTPEDTAKGLIRYRAPSGAVFVVKAGKK